MDLTDIGHTGKARGLGGEVRFKADGDYLEEILQAEVLFLRIQGQPVPYFVETVLEDKMLIKFEGVDNKETATRIAGKVICVETKNLIPKEEKEVKDDAYALQYATCEGLLMVDAEVGELGIVKEVVEYPQQEIALLDYKGKEILVPLNPTFVKSWDTERVLVELPEGLLDL